ncbi:diiron oxygenase [Streptomyces albofaciens JCM 4342]|uniref:AurF N-oxygenase family protein n=1 Tax=Streptomyces albofaciens TaxID=66866 RepID=UPI00123A2F21|nr:diiron oxygenase [Streptomyces albofaciens]KAA6212101.1 diiron oxygenase [Streptomyces albofaciens JCM 4342]
MTDRALRLSRSPHTTAQRLLNASAARSYDPAADIDWSAPLLDDAWFWPPERLALYGTPLWERMDHRQRLELSRHEAAHMAQMGHWFELAIIRMLARHLMNRDVLDARAFYALTEMGDETRHITMFGRLLATLGCPVHRVPAHIRLPFPPAAAAFQDITTFTSALIIEEVLDRLQREAAQDERVQPLVRSVCRLHVAEEARHVSFARAELREAVTHASRGRLAFHRLLTALVASHTVPPLLRPDRYGDLGLAPGEARRQARHNPHHRATMLWCGEKLIAFLTEVDLIRRPQHHLWRRSGLLA